MSDFKFVLTLDLRPFAEGFKSAGKIAKLGTKEIKEILSGIKADIDEKAFDAELKKLDKKIKKYESEPVEIPVELETKKVQNEFRKIVGEVDKSTPLFKRIQTSVIDWGFSLQSVSTIYHSIANVVNELLEKAEAQEKAEQKVEQAVRSTGAAAGFSAGELKNMAAELQEITVFGDEDILNNVTAQLLTFTNIAGDQFKEAQMAAMNLATVLDGDLKSASIQLGKALNDPIANLSALSRSGIQFTQAQKDMVKELWNAGEKAKAQSIILEELNNQYGGQAEAMANTYTGALKQFNNAWGDLQETLGLHILPVLAKFAGLMKSIITIPLSEKIRDQKTEFNALMQALMDTNTEESTKKELIKQLNEKYSHYLKNIDLEKASYDDLKTILKEANDEMSKRIQAAAVDEVLTKKRKKLLTANRKLIEAEIKLQNLKEKPYVDLDRLNTQTKAVELHKEKVAELGEEYNHLYQQLLKSGLIPKESEENLKSTEKEAETLLNVLSELPGEVKIEMDTDELDDVDKLYDSIIAENEAANRKKLKDDEKYLNKKLADQKKYYETVKFADADYYEWKKRQIENEVEAMDISNEKKLEMKRELIEKLKEEEEKAAQDGIDIFQKALDIMKIGEEAFLQSLENSIDELINFKAERSTEEIELEMELNEIEYQEKRQQLTNEIEAAKRNGKDYRKLELERKKLDLDYNKHHKKLLKERENNEKTSLQRMGDAIKEAMKAGIMAAAHSAAAWAFESVWKSKLPWWAKLVVAPATAAGVYATVAAFASAFQYGGSVTDKDEHDFLQQFVPPGEDTLIAVRKGEYVMPVEATAKYFPMLEKMREMSFANGGIVGGKIPSGTQDITETILITLQNINTAVEGVKSKLSSLAQIKDSSEKSAENLLLLPDIKKSLEQIDDNTDDLELLNKFRLL